MFAAIGCVARKQGDQRAAATANPGLTSRENLDSSDWDDDDPTSR
jgi:hypothetical protein